MNTVKGNIMRKIYAIMVIISLLVTNFGVVGEAVISYALEVAETNNANVNFCAYFLDEKGQKVEKMEKAIEQGEEFLYVDIAVKKEGYFNGEIAFEKNNFNIKQEILSEDIQEIKDNKVILKQINAGSTVSVKLAIEPIKEEQIAKENLESKVNAILEGKYVNSKNVEKEKYVEIKGKSEIELKWVSSADEQAELNANLLTNSLYKIDGEDKRIVQVLVESKLKNNGYPVKNEEIEINQIKNAEKVVVHARSIEATNANKEFNEENYEYANGKLTIKVENDEKNISWKKDVSDTFVVTYILGKENNINNQTMQVSSKITTIDEKEITATRELQLEEKEGIVTFGLETSENIIYKGKLYTKEEREYKTTATINVDYEELINNINMKMNNAVYLANEEQREANITYKETKINKQEFLDIFGEEGYITIKNAEGTIVANINKDSKEDENGNIIITYAEGVKAIELTTSKPEKIGSLKIENTKKIVNTDMSREQINELTQIKETTEGNYNEQENVSKEAYIELKNTKSEALLEVNANTLSTIEENKNVKMTAVLLNNNEDKDLYQNPVLRIALPKEVKELSAKCKLLYGNGLSLGEAKIVNENGINVIEIHLTGTQSTYNTELVKGTTIIIYADMKLDELATNAEEQITLTYTNEISTNNQEGNIVRKPIAVESIEGVITTNMIEQYGTKVVGDKETEKVNLPISAEEKEATVKISTINNKGAEIRDAKILGTFPTGEEDNLNLVLTSGINVTTDNENVDIYYTDNENATEDLSDATNKWSKTINEETKKYLIKVDSIDMSEKLEANYTVKIPENLKYNMSAKEDYTVKYVNTQNGAEEEEKVAPIELTTGAGPEINIEVNATVGNEEVGKGAETPKETGNAVTSGEIIKYAVKLTNTGNEDATNVTIVEKVPENTRALKFGKDEEKPVTEGEPEVTISYFKEMEDSELTWNFDKIAVGETKTMTLYLRPETTNQNKTITNNIEVNYNGRVENSYVTNVVNSSDMDVTLLSAEAIADQSNLESGSKYKYYLNMNNLTEKDLGNIDVEFVTNDLFEIKSLEYDDNGEYKTVENTNKITITDKTKAVYIVVEPKVATSENNIAELYGIVNENGKKIRTNKITKNINTFELNVGIEANNVGEIVTSGQEIDYTISLHNGENSINIDGIEIDDAISDMLKVEGVTINGQTLTEDEYVLQPDWESEKESNLLNINTSMQKGEEKTIIVKTKVLDGVEDVLDKDTEIQNNAVVKIADEVVADTDRILHILKAGAQADENDDEYNSDEDDKNYEYDYNAENENSSKDEIGVDDSIEEPTQGQSESQKENNNNQTGNEKFEGTNNNESTEQPATPQENESTEKPQKVDQKTYTISGIAWLDENEDGIKDLKEQKMPNIQVVLINSETNSQIAETQTDSEGAYAFSQILAGKYIVAFKYDTGKYVLTKYQTENATENKNSDAETSEITVNGENWKAGITDTIEIKDASKMYVDIGLIEAKVFDLELTKTIDKITTTNSKGTTTSNYTDANLAKLDIDAKYLSGTTVVIEYKIKVKNNGELAGYAREIVDYMPQDLDFNSELNKDWYKSGNYLYSTSLANTKIEAGETKELTLILTKQMTETNTGLVNNLAEISSDYNSLSIKDKDSTPGNKKISEDDTGSANIVISVKTGAAVSYISLIVGIMAVMIAGAYIVNKKFLKHNITL